MVKAVCHQRRTWMDQGLSPIPISINQSRLLFCEAGYADTLKELITRYQVPARLLVLEIWEGLAMENPDDFNTRIDQLHAAGFKVSMDDFGSGYSSLNILCQIRIDELKIDQGFLRQASDRKDDRHWVILEQIVLLAQRLKIPTVVEGVETQQNEERIRKLGCDLGQGYYYSKPISTAEFTEKYLKASARENTLGSLPQA